MKLKLYFLLFAIGIKSIAFAQIKGKVISVVDSLPLASVNLELSNGKKLTTGAHGHFQIQLPAGSYQLRVSHTGFLTKSLTVIAPSNVDLNIFLQPLISTLQEVVISDGYQRIPKERSTGSFTAISNGKLNEQVGSNLIARLDGVASGFSVDRKTNSGSIMVRGLSTISGPRSPLIVVDNFPYEGNLDNLNPNNVESVVLLKDAAAASIWGTRAGNGVIVITTKTGHFNVPLQIQFNAAYGIAAKPDPFYLKPISSADFIATERFLFDKGYYSAMERSSAHPPLSPVVELLIARRDNKITSQVLESEIARLATYNLSDEYKRSVYNVPTNQQYSVTLSGGAEKMSWSFSTGFDANQTALDALSRRLTINTAQNYKLTKKLMLNTSINYVRSSSQSGKPDLTSLTTINGKLPPYTRLRDDAGLPLAVMKDYSLSYLASAIPTGFLDWRYYPADDYQNTKATTRINDFLGNISLKYNILNGLDIAAYYQYENQLIDGSNLTGQESYAARNLINSYTQVSSGVLKRIVPLGDIYEWSANTLNVHQGRLQLNYSRIFGDHAFTFLAGSEVRSRNVYNTAQKSYGYNSTLLTSATVDYANTYPNFVTGSNTFIPNVDSYNRSVNHFISLYANGAYTYKDRYILSGSLRRDASNLFGVATNDKWNPLWSAGLAWMISKEDFFNIHWVNNLKFRGSYGISGNIDPSRSAVTTIAYSSNSPYTKLPFADFSSYANPELRWESSAMLNLAADFSILRDRISGSVEVFSKKGTDLYGQEVIDYTAGIGNLIQKNAASTRARGIDINLATRNVTGKFHWESDFYLNLYRDKVLDYYLSSQQGSRFLSGDVSITGLKDYPVYAMFSYKWAGLNPENGNPRGLLNGVPSEDYRTLTGSTVTVKDLVYNGPAMPQFNTAIGNTITFGNFGFTFRMSGKFGYFFRRPSLNYLNLFASRLGHADFAARWQNPGDENWTNVPSLVYPLATNRDAFYSGSEVNITKGDHIRLQYINLNYRFVILAGDKRKVVDLFLFSNNLGILWQADKHGIDPDYAQYPPAKTISIGLKTNL